MKIVIIGTGNVAYALGRKIKESSHELLQVAGRHALHVKKIGNTLGVSYTSPVSSLNIQADLYIVAVSDNALQTIGDWLYLDKKLVVHTAGSVSMQVLQKVSRNYGVLYPIQSLTEESVNILEVPFLVDGNSPDDLALIMDFASSISDNVKVADDETRKKLHLAAVIVNNFANHLYVLAEKYCSEEELDFTILHPLIKETASRIAHHSPAEVQTGPAARNDLITIAKQKELLSSHPALMKIYEQITESILRESRV